VRGGRDHFAINGIDVRVEARAAGEKGLTSNPDIIRTAELLVEKHGDEASIEAAMWADEMLDRGDVDGEVFWLKVHTGIKCLFTAP
jgi:hypothetical protein